MSSEGEQPTLDAFDTRSPAELTLEGTGAQYRGVTARDAAAATATPEKVCRNCGEPVPSTIARVLGDNDGCVPACPHCRADVLDEEDLDRGNHGQYARLLKMVRGSETGIGIDPTAGGRR